MGCCITKFRPKKHSIQHSNINVQDKLVISKNPPKSTPKLTPSIPSSNKISPYFPPSPATSNSSVSSFFCTNTINTTATSSISSCSSVSSVPSSSSSILSSKDRSFSNEFLWSCVKENPHIVRINSIKEASQLLLPLHNVHARKLDSPAKQAVPHELKQSLPQRVNLSTQQKKVRSNSPNRQKSFRKELDRVDSWHSSRGLKSPSPSRRFSNNGDNSSKTPAKRATKVNSANNSVISSPRKENMNPYIMMMNSSQYYHHNNIGSCLRNFNRETCIHRINSRIDEVAVEEAVAHNDISSVPMEDIDNPLISLDCFIFL